MEVLNASDAKREFGEMLLKVQNEPVAINKNGKPVAVVMSMQEYEDIEQLKLKRLIQEIEIGLKDVEEGRVCDGEAFFNELIRSIEQ